MHVGQNCLINWLVSRGQVIQRTKRRASYNWVLCISKSNRSRKNDNTGKWNIKMPWQPVISFNNPENLVKVLTIILLAYEDFKTISREQTTLLSTEHQLFWHWATSWGVIYRGSGQVDTWVASHRHIFRRTITLSPRCQDGTWIVITLYHFYLYTKSL